jgi:glucose-1-phosphate adenylyltransferase
MDYGDLLQAHLQTGADVTLGITPVDRAAASGFGIMHSDANRRIYRFEEKPKDPKLLEELRIPPDLLKDMGGRLTQNFTRARWVSTYSIARS